MDEAAGEDEAGTPPRETLHFGLTSMKERAKMIGAEFQVTSAPGKGTRVHLRIPYKKEDIAVPQKAAAKKR